MATKNENKSTKAGKNTASSASSQSQIPEVIRQLKTLEGKQINGTIILNRYYQRNCAGWIPITFVSAFIALCVYIKLHEIVFPWFINLSFYAGAFILLLGCVITVVNLCKFTKFYEVKITEGTKAKELLESYYVVEQRGDIFTLTMRTDELRWINKVVENYIRPLVKRKKEKRILCESENLKETRGKRTLKDTLEEATGRKELNKKVVELQNKLEKTDELSKKVMENEKALTDGANETELTGGESDVKLEDMFGSDVELEKFEY